MVRVNEGTLTLEGLELRVDTPNLKGVSDWSAIVLNGGHLRMLNCSISEDRKNKMAALKVLKPATVLLRNCLLVGGRTALDIETGGEQTVTLDNCVIFSEKGVTALPAGETGALNLAFRRCTVQANDVFSLGKVESPVHITAEGVAFKGNWLGSQMLQDAMKPQNVGWRGSHNLYDVAKWIGANGKPNPRVKDAKTFNALFGESDDKGQSKTLPFVGKKPAGAFSHSIRGEDFEFVANSAADAHRLTTGIDALVIGPGSGYLRFRDSFDYRTWGESRAVATN
jgi:hypothetical protein